MILVVDREKASGERLKSMLEFMDTPEVAIVSPEDWLDRIHETRVHALFLGPCLDDRDIGALFDAVAEYDPNLSIVMLNDGALS